MTEPAPTNDPRIDRLYQLLPPILRESDVLAGRPLQALLRVMAEQANLVEDDITALLDNWFVETCDDWVLPYLGELVGYQPAPENATLTPDDTARGRRRAQALAPRHEIANTIRYRRRKGTLLALEEIATAASNWPARAVEYRQLITALWNSRFPDPMQGGILDLRDRDALDLAVGPFDRLPRLVDLRRISSTRTMGRGNLLAIGLWIWRLQAFAVREGECRSAGRGGHEFRHLERFHIHPAKIDQPLFVRPRQIPRPTEPANELDVPGPIRPRAFQAQRHNYYGESLSVELGWSHGTDNIRWLEPSQVDVADLEQWEQSLPSGHPLWNEERRATHAVLDVRRGRVLMRRPSSDRDIVLWARHHVGFSAEIGGGGYHRLPPPAETNATDLHWYVRNPNSPDDRPRGEAVFNRLEDALDQWKQLAQARRRQQSVQPRRVLIELEDDSIQRLGVANSTYLIEMGPGDRLEIRAAPHRRPVIGPEPGRENCVWKIRGQAAPNASASDANTFVLDGVTVIDYTLNVEGPITEFTLRHCTVIAAKKGRDKALELDRSSACVTVEKSIIVGSIHVDPVGTTTGGRPSTAPPTFLPAIIHVKDSILDGDECDTNIALAGVRHHDQQEHPPAHVRLEIARATVFGQVRIEELGAAEDSIFRGRLLVENTNQGCLRYCSLAIEDAMAAISPTPPRYACQPDLILRQLLRDQPHADEAQRRHAAAAVSPRFTSVRYGDPGYGQLAAHCTDAIRRGASDESEMGVFHDLFQPQREALLRARLAEYTTADGDAQLFYAT